MLPALLLPSRHAPPPYPLYNITYLSCKLAIFGQARSTKVLRNFLGVVDYLSDSWRTCIIFKNGNSPDVYLLYSSPTMHVMPADLLIEYLASMSSADQLVEQVDVRH